MWQAAWLQRWWPAAASQQPQYETIEVDVDGEIQQISTWGLNQERILERAGVELQHGDIVRSQGDLSQGGRLVVRSAKPISLIIDGVARESPPMRSRCRH